MTELPIDENTPRILIVEDEPKLGQLLIDYLRAASYAPTLISHGDQVLPYVRQTPPDLILLDLMLPGTDGLTLCREIRRFSDIPIVMVTAKIEEIDRLLGLEPAPGGRKSPGWWWCRYRYRRSIAGECSRLCLRFGFSRGRVFFWHQHHRHANRRYAADQLADNHREDHGVHVGSGEA